MGAQDNREPQVIGSVLGIVYRAIAGYLRTQADFTSSTAQTAAVTLIQRFGAALNINVHLHMLFLDGVYLESASVPLFRRVKAPAPAALNQMSAVGGKDHLGPPCLLYFLFALAQMMVRRES